MSKFILIFCVFLAVCGCVSEEKQETKSDEPIPENLVKKQPVVLENKPMPYESKPIPAGNIGSLEFREQKHRFYKNFLLKELERTGTDDLRISAYVERYCDEMHNPELVMLDDGAYPAVDRDVIRELCRAGQQLIDEGLNHPVLLYCYYDSFIRSGYDLFTYHFGERKKIARLGVEACLADPQTHPLISYSFCNEMRMRTRNEEKQKWIDRMHSLFPQIFYPTSMGQEFDAVSADLLHQLSRWWQPVEDWRIDADNMLNDSEVPEWVGLYVDGVAHIKKAWELRGPGFANDVSDEGWKGLHEEMSKARESLTKAWELRPDLPEAPRQMIDVAKADSIQPNEKRKWLDRTLAARVDYRDAYWEYSRAVMERWFGSLEQAVAFAKECVDTKRYDTCVPFQAVEMLEWIYFDANYPDVCPASEDYLQMFETLYGGYRESENLSGENRTAVLSIIAALSVKAGGYNLAHQILSDIGYQFDRRYLKKEYGLYFEDYIWKAWCNGSPAADLITKARQDADSGQTTEAKKLYEQVLATPNIPPQAADRLLNEKALIDFRRRSDTGEWVDIYSGETAPEWVNKHSHWGQDKDGWLKSDILYPACWLPVEMSLLDGFDLELDVGSRSNSSQRDTYIYLCNPSWHDFQRPYIKLSYGKKELSVLVGRDEINGQQKIQKTARFNPTGNDHLRITVKKGVISVACNNETIIGGVTLSSNTRYRDKISLALGDHDFGKYNAKNRYNNIRIRMQNQSVNSIAGSARSK